MTDQSANIESQKNELMALEAILDERQFLISNEPIGGQLSLFIDLPSPFQISYYVDIQSKSDENLQVLDVQCLPPLIINFELPSAYPCDSLPHYTLSCKWLTRHQLSSLCEELDNIWREYRCEVLFEWVQYIQENTLNKLKITSPLLLMVDSSYRKGLDTRAIQDVDTVMSLVEEIVAFDKRESERKFLSEYFTCGVCFEEKQGSSCIRFPQCKHVTCKPCMTEYFRIQINDGSVRALTCSEQKCEMQADPALVKELVDVETYDKYERFLLQVALDCMNDVVYCPRCKGLTLKEAGINMGRCPSCIYTFCTLCTRCYHGVSSCPINSKEMLALREKYLNGSEAEKEKLEKQYGRKVLKHAVEDLYSESWIATFSKPCPSCNSKIEKINGCNKMLCSKCQQNFCWLCNKILSRNDPYAHFNLRNGACYNQLFQGVEDEDLFDELDDDEPWVHIAPRL